jgi:hypothetical protein
MPAMDVTVFEIVPHPLHLGHWLLKANQRLPCGLWYGELLPSHQLCDVGCAGL